VVWAGPLLVLAAVSGLALAVVGATRAHTWLLHAHIVVSALGGLLLVLYKSSGDPLNGVGLELTAIAAVVIGGTLLTGGSGYVLGTVLGIMVLGIIQTLITFDGTLNSWWTSIITGALLFVFIVLQRLVTRRAR